MQKETENISTDYACMILNGLKGMGAITMHKLLSHFENDPLKILYGDRKTLKKVSGLRSDALESLINWSSFDFEYEQTQLEKLEGSYISYFNSKYPKFLKQIPDAPIGLYCLGNSNVLNQKSVAIVGSRRCTLYGVQTAKKLAFQLAKQGYSIVSGMARGIDTAAHEGALEADGTTVAVLGCGADVIYPPENKSLYHAIQRNGAVLSEFSLGKSGDKYTFPMRNRIVSGMTQGLIVIETDSRGGSMITARMAAEQNRQVFALPGRIDQVSSRGCHQLIRDGATLIRGVEDILEELDYANQLAFNFENQQEEPSNEIDLSGLSEAELKVFTTLREGGLMGPDSIEEASGLMISQVHASLLMLEIKKLLKKHPDGRFEAA